MADLVEAIQAVDGEQVSGMLGVNYEINLTANLNLSAAIPFPLRLGRRHADFEGNGHTIDGGNVYGGFYLR
jgi:large repetitive protein